MSGTAEVGDSSEDESDMGGGRAWCANWSVCIPCSTLPRRRPHLHFMGLFNAPRPTLQTPSMFSCAPCVLFVCCIHHCIIALHPSLFFKHASDRSCRAPLASVDPSETNLALRFPSCLNRSPSLHSASPPRARPKFVPNPNQTFVTVGSGSSPNIYKTSPFSLLDALAYLFSTARL